MWNKDKSIGADFIGRTGAFAEGGTKTILKCELGLRFFFYFFLINHLLKLSDNHYLTTLIYLLCQNALKAAAIKFSLCSTKNVPCGCVVKSKKTY